MSTPPEFLHAMRQETEATDGDIVTFQVKVAGNPEPAVTWFRCGETVTHVAGRSEIVTHGDGWHELVITNVTEGDEGEYECRAENVGGSTSCYGALFYYSEGHRSLEPGAEATEGALQDGEGDGRQSALLILIDDGSQTEEECGSGGRKSMTASEQIQGIIEDLAQDTQDDNTGSLTLDRDEDFNSETDIPEDLLDQNFMEAVYMAAQEPEGRASLETMVPEEAFAGVEETPKSEGTSELSSRLSELQAPRWKSSPSSVSAPPVPSPPLGLSAASELRYPDKFGKWLLGDATLSGVADISTDDAKAPSGPPALGRATDDSVTARATGSPQTVPGREDSDWIEDTGSKVSAEECDAGDVTAMSYSRSSRSTTTRYREEPMEEYSRTSVTSVRSSRVSSSSSSRYEIEDSFTSAGRTGNGTLSSSSLRRSARSAALKDEDDSFTWKRSKVTAYDADESSAAVSERITTYAGDTSYTRTSRASAYSESYMSDVSEPKGRDVYVAIMDFRPMETDEEAIPMKEGQEVEILDASRPRRWLVRTVPMPGETLSQEGWVPCCYLEKTTIKSRAIEVLPDPKNKEDLENREAIVKELVETEDDFARDMQYVVDNYYKQMDNPRMPKSLRDQKQAVFRNFKDICDFHNNVLIKGVQYHAKEPTKLGKTLLRLERDFDMHISYSQGEHQAQQLLVMGPLKEYFEEHSKLIDDDKTLSEHLKLPIQRINDYILLLKELIKYSSKLDENTADLEKALAFMQSISRRTTEFKYLNAMQGYRGNLGKLGRLLKHDWFDVTDSSGQTVERYALLFSSGRLLLTEVVKSSPETDVYRLQSVIKVPDADVTEEVPGDQLKFSISPQQGGPLLLRSRSLTLKEAWVKELTSPTLRQAADDLGEEEPVVVPEAAPQQEAKEPDLEKAKIEPQLEPKKAEVASEEGPKPDRKPEAKEVKAKPEPEPKEPEPRKTEVVAEAELKRPAAESEPAPKPSETEPEPKRPKVEEKAKEVPQAAARPSEGAGKEEKKAVAEEKKAVAEEKKEEPAVEAASPKQKAEARERPKGSDMDGANKPKFSKPLRGITCSQGETVAFECEVDSPSKATVTWLKDNQRVTKSNRVKSSGKGGLYTLTIKDTCAEDAGLYTVMANNASGSVSCSAHLNLKTALLGVPKEDSRPTTPGGTLIPHAPVFKVKLKDTQLLEGTSVRFELVVRGHPEPQVTFYKNDKELKEDDHVHVSYESKEVFELIIDHMTPEDAATYSCVAVNSEGRDTTSGQISVTKHKVLFQGLEDESDFERSPTPRPKKPVFKWFKDGQDFEASERFKVSFNEEEDTLALLFQHVTPDDAGLYTCVASTSTGSKIACSAELTVQGVVRQLLKEPETPTIKAELTDVEVGEGASAMLELKVSGYPKPKVTWFKDGKEVVAGDRFRFMFGDEQSFTLVVKNVKKEDAGKFSATATNEIGEATTSCQLIVKAPPAFKKSLKDSTVKADEPAQFEVEIEGKPTPEVKWYKDGQQISPSNRIKMLNPSADKYVLRIEKSKPEDAGKYSCVLTNSSGSQAAYGNLAVKAAPSFVQQMKDVEGVEGEVLSFSVKVAGNPKPTVKWSKDGKPLQIDGKHIKVIEEEANSYVLVVDKVTAGDVGKYTCEISNENGSKSSTASLGVKSKPNFTKKLADVETKEGETVELSVSVQGCPSPSIKWMRDGKELSASKSCAMSGDAATGNYSLKLQGVSVDASGKYGCEATNSAGSAVTSGVLSVREDTSKHQPPNFVKRLTDQVIVVGDACKFEVQVSGIPKPQITWCKGDAEVTAGDRVKIASDLDSDTYSMTVKNLAMLDSGKYSCKAKNDKGEASDSCSLTVKEPVLPNISGMADVEVEENTVAKFQVNISGFPVPEVKWLKNGQLVKTSDNVAISCDLKTETYTLVVKRAKKDNSGQYTVIASNLAGEARKDGKLGVKGAAGKKPQFTQDIKPTQLAENKPGKLEAKVTGEPKPEIKWMKDGKEVLPSDHFAIVEEPDGTTSLIITNVTPDDAGTYAVVAVSDGQESKTQAVVSTIPSGLKPYFTKELEKVSLPEGERLRLEAKVEGKPTSVKWSKDGDEIAPSHRIKLAQLPDGTVSFQIDHVTPEDAGKYTVLASNAEGKARSASLVEVKAQLRVNPEIVQGLQPVAFAENEPGELTAKVAGKPRPTVQWIKDGQEIVSSDRIQMKELPDGTVSLVIDKVLPEDLGKYAVVATNENGQCSSSAPLSINQPPVFKKFLGATSAVESYPAKLEAKLSGSPPPEVQWLKDGEPLVPDGKHIKSVLSPDGSVALIFDKCTPEDSGKYTCVASNSLGEDSTLGDLTVAEKSRTGVPDEAPSFVTPLGNVSAVEGEPLRLEATVAGSPLPEVEWVLNGRPLEMSDNVHQIFDGQKAILEIKHATPLHAGRYECRLSSPLGDTASRGSAEVTEHKVPRFMQRLSDITAPVTKPIHMTCKVKGFPEPAIEWSFNGNVLYPGDKYRMSNVDGVCSLSIDSPHPKDAGIYECKATNPAGEDSCRAAVNFSERAEKGEAPSFLKKIGDCEIIEGMTAKFTACVAGIPLPEMKWFKDGQPLEPSLRFKMELETTGLLRLIVRDCEPSDLGEYSVTVSNPHGTASCSAHLRAETLDVKYPLRPIGDQFVDFDKFKKTGIPVPLADKPYIIRMGDHFLTLAWKPSVPTAPRVPVTYQIEMAKHPDGDWSLYKSGIKDSVCDVLGLEPNQDYKFRIRVENKYGVSDPSPYYTAQRSRVYDVPEPKQYKPKDYELEHPDLEKHAEAPRFLRREEDTMYGIRGQPVTVEFWVYGYPEPNITWCFEGCKIETGKYDFLQDRNGRVSVFISSMSDSYAGTYTCLAVNDHGDAIKKIKLLLAEPPVFTERLDRTTVMVRRSGRMECRVKGVPTPTVKWFKDWHPLYDTERVKLLWEDPDRCTMFLSGTILKDSGLYSCTAVNLAGKTSCSAMFNVEEDEADYGIITYGHIRKIRARTKPFEDFYDIGDELGRGTQGIVYHAVERDTGSSYAAKTMHGKGKLRDFMTAEMDMMNQLCHPRLVRLWDAFDTKKSLSLITDLCGGGELLDHILKRNVLTERDVANYVRQILQGLEYMHNRFIGHLGLTVGDVLVTRINGDAVKLGDFSLTKHLVPGQDFYVEYGHPEFVAPELANKKPVSLASDMWSVGVISYLLLSGISPFLAENDRETLKRVQEGKINFVPDAFLGVSDEAKDFMSRLLVFEPSGRMNVKTALQHPWLTEARPMDRDLLPLANLQRLREYYRKWKDWYANASCKRFYRRRTLESCFYHPSRMIYPPGEMYTPPSSPEPETDRTPVKPSAFDDTFQQKITREPIDVSSESNYQYGPDTYLLQLRDTEFPLRLREYLRVGARTNADLACNLRDKHWGDSLLVIRERRKFVDVMDEEIVDERKGLSTRDVPMRLHHEMGTMGYAHEQMELLKQEVWKDKGSREEEIGMMPYFREKIQDVVIQEEEEGVFRCCVVGKPAPSVAWFRNDGILLESHRVVVKELPDGVYELRLKPCKPYDVGIYKCVARNACGISICRARLKIGSTPGRPDAPQIQQISDTEVFLTWSPPRYEGNCPTLCYCLEYKKGDEEEWTKVASNIGHEFFVIRDLTPSGTYQYRVTAKNKFGWGFPGTPTEQTSTKESGAEKVRVSTTQKFQQELTEQTTEEIEEDTTLPELDFSKETNPVPMEEKDPMELVRVVAELARGRFSVIVRVWVKETTETGVAKVIQSTPETAAAVRREYDIMKSLCHPRIADLKQASCLGDQTVLVLEKLSGMDVLNYLTQYPEYSEETISRIMSQVLEAIEYLHFRDICYIELQPDNIVMVDQRHPNIKLVDFGSAHFVPKTGSKVNVQGTLEYLAPEILKKENASPLTDIWAVGVLTYILLSGSSPFQGENNQQTEENILFVRYCFDKLHKEVTTEATRFLMQIFKRCPIKRPTVEECLQHKWLVPSEFMLRKRENTIFSSDPLLQFSKQFHRAKEASTPPELFNSLGMASARSAPSGESL